MRRYDGVIFDMDGTLIESLLDFREIRAALGIAPRDGIIEAIAAMGSETREHAGRWLLEQEITAASDAVLIAGAGGAVGKVRSAGLKTALLTRNAAEAMKIVLAKFPDLRFDLTWSREDGPIKPEPDGILRACRELAITPQRTLCVGDFHYDLTAAKAAGATSVLLARGKRPAFADQADYVITDMSELPGLLGIQ